MVVRDLQQSFSAVTALNNPPLPLHRPPPSSLGWACPPWFDEEYTETSRKDGGIGRPRLASSHGITRYHHNSVNSPENTLTTDRTNPTTNCRAEATSKRVGKEETVGNYMDPLVQRRESSRPSHWRAHTGTMNPVTFGFENQESNFMSSYSPWD